MKRSGWLGLAGAMVSLALVLGACSTTSEQVQDKISKQVQTQLKLASAPPTTCPKDAKAKKGSTFACTVTIDGQTATINVVFTKDDTFNASLDGRVETISEVESTLKSSFEADSAKCATTKTQYVVTKSTPLKCTVTKGTDSKDVTISWDGKTISVN